MSVKRVYVEKRDDYAFEARDREKDFQANLKTPVKKVRVLHRYDVEGLNDEDFQRASTEILSDGATEDIYFEDIPDVGENDQVFASEYRPGQFNQRVHSAEQIIAMMTRGERPRMRYAKVFVVEGGDVDEIKEYLINKEDAREATMDKYDTLEVLVPPPAPVRTVDNFRQFTKDELEKFLQEGKYAMSLADAEKVQEYFKKEDRDPTVTELRVIDAYWSDHCRHTTFNTVLDKVEFADNQMSERAKHTYKEYLQARKAIGDRAPISLMDLATIYLREAKYRLPNYDDSDEKNAASFRHIVTTDEGPRKYLIMFKNETGNSRTEADPLGGAATCLGGVIRDPMVERAYTYQAMRVAGSGDPREKTADTIPGHLPQRVLSRQSARGFANYSKGVGVPTGLADEVYHPGYKAKHMEIGAVIGAVPEEDVRRSKPQPGDVIIMLGGRTGRDGVGQATGASAPSGTDATPGSGPIVQKGNPPTERKLQRLFRNEDFTVKIKRANDFGAGGIAVAVAELAPGVEVTLDEMPVKYPGLDGTELAISESQERIAVVVAPEDEAAILRLAADENIRANRVAKVTDDNRVKLSWDGRVIVDLDRKFLNSNGASQHVDVEVDLSDFSHPFAEPFVEGNFEETLLQILSDINVASRKGMQEMFDSTVGAATIAMPLGGRNQITPIQAMSATVPCPGEISRTATLMSYGLDPYLMEQNPYGGAVYALLDSVAKVVASGGSVNECWLSLQEYFPYLYDDPKRWGQPLAALLGAYMVEKGLHIAAIGGKDSMNGSSGDLEVPPTLCSFCVAPVPAEKVITPEFKSAGHKLYLLDIVRDEDNLPVFADVDRKYENLHALIDKGTVVSAYAVGRGGYLAGAAKSALGNNIGVHLYECDLGEMVSRKYGAILVEAADEIKDADYKPVGELIGEPVMTACGQTVPLEQVAEAYLAPLERVFPRVKESEGALDTPLFEKEWKAVSKYPTAVPRCVIPVFPGTTGEIDTWKAMNAAGAECVMIVIRNQSPSDLQQSLATLASEIQAAQMIVIPGGASAADEPDGAGKMIAAAFRSGQVYDATMELLQIRDGLMLGISNGFQGLIRLGLLPFGDYREPNYESPTLTTNIVGRTVSTIVQVRVTSAYSPWLQFNNPGEIHSVIVSSGEGRFMAPQVLADQLARNGQIAAQYVDPEGQPTMDPRYNPSGSMLAVESLMSPDGRILGVMGHWERMGPYTAMNVPGNPDLTLFEGGVAYFN